jgi:hypothetical protein
MSFKRNIWWFGKISKGPAFVVDEKLQVHLCALFHALAGT